MLTRADLPRRRFVRPAEERALIDAWFTALALPASLYLGWIRSLHGAARHAR